MDWVGSSHLNHEWASLEWRELWASLRLDPFCNILFVISFCELDYCVKRKISF